MSSANYATGLGRAFIGAMLFALPLLMTMEMWQFGFAIAPLRLATLLVVTVPMLVALSHFAGFEPTFGAVDDVLDAFAAFAVAVISSTVVLALLGVLAPTQPFEEIATTVAVVSFPGAIGALLADKQLGAQERGRRAHATTYFARLFVMTIGALFVALNVAPTDEIMLIAFQMSPWQAFLVAIVSVALLHALLFWVDFPGRATRRGDAEFWSIFIRYSVVGYALCCSASFLLLWAFGRTEGVSLSEVIEFAVVLSFPGALGAGLAGLVVGDDRG